MKMSHRILPVGASEEIGDRRIFLAFTASLVTLLAILVAAPLRGAPEQWGEAASYPRPISPYAFAQDGEDLDVISGNSNGTIVNTLQWLYPIGSTTADPSTNSNVSMRLDMATNTWSTGPVRTPRRADFALAAVGTRLFAIGGDSGGGDDYSDPPARVDEPDTSHCPTITFIGTLTASDGTQVNRVTRVAPGSVCGTAKAFPGTQPGQPGPFAFDQYSFTNSGPDSCVTFTVDAGFCPGNNFIFPVAYLGSFDPNNISANYLGDPGSSPNPVISFSVDVPANSTVVLVVSEVVADAGCPDPGYYKVTINPTCPLIVTTTDDHNNGSCGATDCTLREAINAANGQAGKDFINFAPGVTGTIQLATALPTLGSNITLQGPGADLLTVRRNSGGNYRIFTVSNGTNDGPVVEISGLTISNGLVSGVFPANSGAGVFNDNSSVTLSHCAMNGNSASYGGALSNVGLAGLTVRNCTLNGNTASFNGGALYNVCTVPGFAAVELENCTLSGNSSGTNGGAISNYVALDSSSVVQVKSCTFSGNSATGAGGAIHNQRDTGSATVQIANNIFQTGASGANLVNTGGASLTSSGYNLSNDNGGGFLIATGDQINKNPMLGPLQNNGGPTFTHALLAGSPAIDKGRSFLLTTDQRGVGYLRIIDDPSIAPPSGGDNTDIGAFEFGASFNAVSRKIHGSFEGNIPLPVIGNSGIECRSGGASGNHPVVVTFPGPITVGDASVTSNNAADAPTAAFAASGNVVTLDLNNIANARRLTINLLNVSDGSTTNNVSIPIGILLGDTNGNGNVSNTDVSAVKAQVSSPVTASNFRADVNANGTISNTDVSTTKAQVSTSLP